MRILYVSYRESLSSGASTGVMQTQVLDVFEALDSAHEIRWLVLSDELPQARAMKQVGRVEIVFRNIGRSSVGIDRLAARRSLRSEVAGFIPDVIHVRGYNAAVIAGSIKTAVPRIFDPRTLLPLERAAHGSGLGHSVRNLCWRKVERWLVQKYDLTIAVSEPMQEILSADAEPGSVVWVPLAADYRRFALSLSRRARIRDDLGYSDEDIVVLYSGALQSVSTAAVAGILRRILVGTPHVRFLFITRDDPRALIAAASSLNVDLTVRVATPAEVPDLLVAGDWGLIFTGLKDAPQHAEIAFGSTVLGTKTPEYWAVGLGLVVAEHLVWLAHLTQEHDLGVVAEVGSRPIVLEHRTADERSAAMAFQRKRFDVESIADQLASLYQVVTRSRR